MAGSRTVLLAALVAALLASVGFAQSGGPTVAEAPTAELSSSEMLQRAKEMIAGMQDVLRGSLDRLEGARKEKDIVQVNCINDKLSSIRGLLKIAELSAVSLREAIDQRDDELIQHEYTKIALSSSRVEGFRVEIESCVGELSQYTGATEVEASVDPDVRDDDPSEGDVIAFAPIDIDRPSEDSERPPSITPNR